MTNYEQNQKPENLDIEYSGSYEGDPRDPQSIGDAMPLLEAEIRERAEKPELYAARDRVKELTDRQANDFQSVSPEELDAAISNAIIQEHLEVERNKQRRAD